MSRLPYLDIDAARILGKVRPGTFVNAGHAEWVLRDDTGAAYLRVVALRPELLDLGLTEVERC